MISTILRRLSGPSVLFALVLTVACDNKNFETCGGDFTCPPPVGKDAPADLTKIREEIAGKWKLTRIATRDTLHKNAPEGNWVDTRAHLCMSYDGGVQYVLNLKELACTYCYMLKKANDTLRIEFENLKPTPFCRESVQSGMLQMGGDSLVITRQDSFVIKRFIYRRMNDDGSLKVK